MVAPSFTAQEFQARSDRQREGGFRGRLPAEYEHGRYGGRPGKGPDAKDGEEEQEGEEDEVRVRPGGSGVHGKGNQGGQDVVGRLYLGDVLHLHPVSLFSSLRLSYTRRTDSIADKGRRRGIGQIDLPIHRTGTRMERRDHREPDALQHLGRHVDPPGDLDVRVRPPVEGHAEEEGRGG